MFKLLILFIFIFFYKFFINLGRLIRIKMLYKYYFSLCTPNTNPKVWETKREVITLFKKAVLKMVVFQFTTYGLWTISSIQSFFI